MPKSSFFLALMATSLVAQTSHAANNEPSAANQGGPGTYDFYENKECEGVADADFSKLEIKSNYKKYKRTPTDSTATILITGEGNDVCLNGSIAQLEITKSLNDVYVNGSVSSMSIPLSGNDVFVFGSVDTMKIKGNLVNVYVFGSVGDIKFEGRGSDVFASKVGSFEDAGVNNEVRDISEADFD